MIATLCHDVSAYFEKSKSLTFEGFGAFGQESNLLKGQELIERDCFQMRMENIS